MKYHIESNFKIKKELPVSKIREIEVEILRAFVDKIIIYEKQKVDGHIRHTIEIVYNFVEAIELPDFDSWDNYNY